MKTRTLYITLLLLSSLLGTKSLLAEDFTLLGGDLSTDLPGRHAIQVAAPNMATEERRNYQLSGFSPFHTLFGKENGVGPRFSNRMCGGCHVDNGRGPLDLTGTLEAGSTAILKIGIRQSSREGVPRNIRRLTNQLPISSPRQARRFKVNLRWRTISGTYPDGTPYELRTPKVDYEIRRSRINPRRIVTSLRMSSTLIGMGLLESISDEEILSRHDPYDIDNDGISGRANFVTDLETNETKIGRFGFKASNTTVKQQAAGAFFNDMGMTTSIIPSRRGVIEVTDDTLDRLAFYVRLGGVPEATNQGNSNVIAGAHLFNLVGCNDCHVTTMTTGSHDDPELVGQVIHPFTDMLLHNMGRGLADKFREFDGTGSEWRTTPLWGLGFSSTISNVVQLYLHDGRARSIEEAILWHGGEAEPSKVRFTELDADERQQLVTFLRSL